MSMTTSLVGWRPMVNGSRVNTMVRARPSGCRTISVARASITTCVPSLELEGSGMEDMMSDE